MPDNRGGARPGAGRPPGRSTTRSTVTTTRPAQSSTPPYETPQDSASDNAPTPVIHAPLASLPPAVQSAITLSARGLSNNQIAGRLDKDPHTIAKWLRQYPDAIDEAVRQLTDPAEVMRPMLTDALRVYGETLGTGDADGHTRLRAAQDVMDRLYGKPTMRTEITTRTAIRVEFGAPEGALVDDVGPAADSDDDEA